MLESFEDIFLEAQAANPDVSKWNTEKVTTMERLFAGAAQVEPDVSEWRTSKVRSMERTFAETGTHIQRARIWPDVSKWDTSAVTTMKEMFIKFTGLVLLPNSGKYFPDVGSWDTSSVKTISGMFQDTENILPSVSKWDVRQVEDMSQALYADTLNPANMDTSSWNIHSATNFYNFIKFDLPLWLFKSNIMVPYMILNRENGSITQNCNPTQKDSLD